MKSFLILICLLAFSKLTPAQYVYSCTDGYIQFHSDAPLEIIKASSKKLNGALHVDHKTFAFSVKLSSFEGFNSKLQRDHFNENYLESKEYPLATFKGKIIEDLIIDVDSTYDVRAKGILSIHGIETERIIKVKLKIEKTEIQAQCEFTILLKDHDIRIPKVVHEKITSEVFVKVVAALLPIKINK